MIQGRDDNVLDKLKSGKWTDLSGAWEVEGTGLYKVLDWEVEKVGALVKEDSEIKVFSAQAVI